MNPQATIKALANGKYLVHFYNDDNESNLHCTSLQHALDVVSGFHKAVARSRNLVSVK